MIRSSSAVRSFRFAVLTLAFALALGGALTSRPMAAEPTPNPTFHKDIAPILQRSCQGCHRPDSLAPMSLITYEEVRPWAKSIKYRTSLGTRMGVMPPWFIDKHVGIQAFKNDISLSDKEVATIAAWVDRDAPRGNPSDAPPPAVFLEGRDTWAFGEPDLVVDSKPVTMKAGAPDWWGALPPTPLGLKEDRYVAAVQIKEISSVKGPLGGKYIFHHAPGALIKADGTPGDGVGGGHEVGRNAEFLEADAAPLITAGSQLAWNTVHLHASDEDTTAFLRVGYKFHPKGYKPKYKVGTVIFGTSEIDVQPMVAGQEAHFYKTLKDNMMITTFEPHMHAAGVRLCLEAIWGERAEMLSCSGYDHNWVRVYKYADNAAPLLPKGTILHVICYFDNTPANRNVVDPRNWSGFGHRSIDNMAIVLVPGAVLSDAQFQEEMAARRSRLSLTKGQPILGCPLCSFDQFPRAATDTSARAGN